MEAPWTRRGLRTRPGLLPSPCCPFQGGFRAGAPGRGLAAEPRRQRGGRTLTRGLRACARRRAGDENAGALVLAPEEGGGKGHSEEPTTRAAQHRQPARFTPRSPQRSGGLTAASLAHVRRSDAPLPAGPSPEGGACPSPPAPLLALPTDQGRRSHPLHSAPASRTRGGIALASFGLATCGCWSSLWPFHSRSSEAAALGLWWGYKPREKLQCHMVIMSMGAMGPQRVRHH